MFFTTPKKPKTLRGEVKNEKMLLFEHEEYIYALLKASDFIDLVFFGMCPIFVDKSNFVYRWLLYIKSNNIEKKILGLIFIHLKLTFNH